jgi:hypothetical protein
MWVDLIFVHAWYKHLIISTCLLAITPVCNLWAQIVAIAVTTLVFACIEKALKEDWVLLDSFKKAHNIHLKLVDRAPYPTLVLDLQGRVLYWNAAASQLFPSATSPLRPEARGRSFLDIVPADFQEKVCRLLKNAATGATFQAEVQLCDIELSRARETQPKDEEPTGKSAHADILEGKTEHRTSAQSLASAGSLKDQRACRLQRRSGPL